MQRDITFLSGKSLLTRLEREHIAMQELVCVYVCVGMTSQHHHCPSPKLRLGYVRMYPELLQPLLLQQL